VNDEVQGLFASKSKVTIRDACPDAAKVVPTAVAAIGEDYRTHRFFRLRRQAQDRLGLGQVSSGTFLANWPVMDYPVEPK